MDFLLLNDHEDLTLRSGLHSVPSIYLISFSMNIYFIPVEKRLDDHRRSVGLMSFWPATTNNISTAPNEEKSELEQQQQTFNNTCNNPPVQQAQNNPNFAFQIFP